MKVLLVEDNLIDREVLKHILEHYGCVVTEAEGGIEGLKVLENYKPDIIVSDLLMPKMDGYEFLRQIRKDKKLREIPFVIYTGSYVGKEEEEFGIALGADAFLMKPMDAKGFWNEIQKILLGKSLGVKEVKEKLKEEDGEYFKKYAYIVAAKLEEKLQELEKAKAEIEKGKDFLDSIMDGIEEGVAVIDRDYTIITANRGFCKQIKRSLDDVVGKKCHSVSHNLEQPCFMYPEEGECAVKKCFETGLHSMAVHKHIDEGGNAVYIETNAYPFRSESGENISAIVTYIDITSKVILEKQLRETKERFEKLYDNVPDMLYSVDGRGIIIACNKVGAETLELSLEELIGIPYKKIIPDKFHSLYDEQFELLKRTGEVEIEIEYVLKSGKKIPVFVKAKAVYDDTGNFLFYDTVARNISERKIMEEQLRRSQKMEVIGQLAGGVAHDFNNILTAITGFATLLQIKMRKDDPLRGNVNEILASAERAAQVTNSLLTLSRKQVINLKPFNINGLILYLKKFITRLIPEDIELKFDLFPEELFVLADSGQIDQVLINMVTNARDAMPNGGELVISTQTSYIDEEFIKFYGFGKPGKYALINIFDTGTGMTQDIKNKIFDPFFTTKDIGKGTGLGLSIVYGIVTQHNGFIDVVSELERGTLFTIYLPVYEKKVEEDKDYKPDTYNLDLYKGNETVLIAEDDEGSRKFYRDILEEFGYKVITAEDGKEAVEMFINSQSEISLIILDVVLPKKNGREVFDEVKKIKPEIKSIFISGYTADVIHSKGILDETFLFLAKPISPIELLKKIRKVLNEQENH